MDPVTFFSAILISLISAAGITANNIITNKKELALREMEQRGADRSRLLEQKHAAYAALLKASTELRGKLTHPVRDVDTRPAHEAFWTAVDHATLVSSVATSDAIKAYAKEKFATFGRGGGAEHTEMMRKFAEELGTAD
jgi:hypothetical protein